MTDQLPNGDLPESLLRDVQNGDPNASENISAAGNADEVMRDVDAETEREQSEFRHRSRHGGEVYPGEREDEQIW